MQTFLEIAHPSVGTGHEHPTDVIWSSKIVLSAPGDRRDTVRSLIEDYALVSGLGTDDLIYLSSSRVHSYEAANMVFVTVYDEAGRISEGRKPALTSMTQECGRLAN
jgi:hypothetical protein